MKVKKFNKLFESKKSDIENLYLNFHEKDCISGMLYLLETTNINPNINPNINIDGNSLAYLDEYEKTIESENEYITYAKFIKTLIEKGADINCLDIDGFPPIVLTSYENVISMLLDADCDLNI